jgi:hypothetical protein
MTDTQTNSNPNQDIIAKVRKLLRHGDSAQNIGNLEEAQAFAAKAQELMFKHKIEMTEVEAEAYLLNEPITDLDIFGGDYGMRGSKRIGWWSILVAGLSKAYFCRAVGHSHPLKRNVYTIHGRETDRKEFLEMLRYLTDAAVEMSEKQARDEFRRYGRVPKAYRNSFKLGFANAVGERMKSKAKELMSSNETGLVLVDRINNELDGYLQHKYRHLTTGKKVTTKGTGYGAGQAYGRSIGINSTKRLAA